MNISYKLQDFSDQYKPFINNLSSSWEDLLWASITVGKKNRQEILKHGIYSIFDITSKIHMIFSVIKEDTTTGKLIKTDLYQNMDATEKAMVSYNLGMMSSKLISSKLFDIQWLIHLSNLNNISTWQDTKSRPDLVGLNRARDWAIVEAKGRSNNYDKDAIDKAKEQTRKIKAVNGQYPFLKIATESFFKNSLNIAVRDPEDFDEDAKDLKIDINQYFETYYLGISSVIDKRDLFHEEYGVSILLDDIVEKAIRNKDYKLLSENKEYLKNIKYGDGIGIKLNTDIWSEENMSLEPVDRNF